MILLLWNMYSFLTFFRRNKLNQLKVLILGLKLKLANDSDKKEYRINDISINIKNQLKNEN